MKVMMRLYRQHDLDLIYLYKLKEFPFQDAVKHSIRACIKGTPLKLKTPSPIETIKTLELPKTIQLHIYLSPKTEGDIIEWINLVTKGYRNSVLKNVLRCHLDFPALEPYSSETSIVFKTSKTPKIDLNDTIIYAQHMYNDQNVDIDALLSAPIQRGIKKVDSSLGDHILKEKEKFIK